MQTNTFGLFQFSPTNCLIVDIEIFQGLILFIFSIKMYN
jgi:hypothetical protein